MGWLAWVIVVALVVFGLRSLWAGYEALAHEPRKPGRAALEFFFAGIDVLLILYIFGVIP